MSAEEEYEASSASLSAPAPAAAATSSGSVGLGSRSVVYTGTVRTDGSGCWEGLEDQEFKMEMKATLLVGVWLVSDSSELENVVSIQHFARHCWRRRMENVGNLSKQLHYYTNSDRNECSILDHSGFQEMVRT
jgi:hypothetical protein